MSDVAINLMMQNCKRNKNVETPSDGQPPNTDRVRNASSRWSIASWLRWIFEDELLDGPGNGLDDIYVQGQYFGPADSKPNLGNVIAVAADTDGSWSKRVRNFCLGPYARGTFIF